MPERELELAEVLPTLRRFLDGDHQLFDQVYLYLAAVVYARAASSLALVSRSPAREEVLDVAQSIWLSICEKNYQVLRRFDPHHPRASLRAYVGKFASWRAADLVRSKRRSDAEVPFDPEDFERCLPLVHRFEASFENRDLALAVLGRVHGELRSKGRQALAALYVEGLSTPEAVERTGMSAAALNSWRRDIRQLAKRVRDELEGQPSSMPTENSRLSREVRP